jgi:hypothetical protein
MFEQNAFADTAFADDRGNFTFINTQIKAVEHIVVTKALDRVPELYQWLIRHPTLYLFLRFH